MASAATPTSSLTFSDVFNLFSLAFILAIMTLSSFERPSASSPSRSCLSWVCPPPP
eukprot:CAMPEP_0197565636 /NCGR_PEP_ID=MMETSP1320-20131121/32500_1 /TAXON_ID=91990 /ORGANISM="Bolidomonas sp., Strain RCC2347" /LENGTH=55 /DNA_ID=CAMNT_0043127641 /DNA_START=62 /DNA_END=226 /DNA_ORIENTATION=-